MIDQARCVIDQTRLTYFFSPINLTFIKGHNCVSNLTNVLLVHVVVIFRTTIKLWHDGRVMHGVYAHAHVDDLNFDARSIACQRKKLSVELS